MEKGWRLGGICTKKGERDMAGRLPKKGMDYSSWSVDLFDNDTKIDKLLDAQSWNGFGVYFYLCQRAYGSEGYFYQWSYDDCASTARKMGGGIGSGTVRETVGYCLQIGLFDKGLFDRWGVLTSRGIQKRYMAILKDRDVRKVIAEYWLLQDSENCKGLIKVPLNRDLSEWNTDFSGGNKNFPKGNSNFLPIKESKGKKRKEKENTKYSGAEPDELAAAQKENVIIELILKDKTMYPIYQEEMEEWKRLYTAVDILQELRKMKGWCDSNPTKRKTERGIKRFICNWLAGQQDKYSEQKEYQKQKGVISGNYMVSKKSEKKGFDNFEQRNYDFQELERKLMG